MTNEPARTPTTHRVGGPDVAWRHAGEQIVVLDIKGSVYFGLNGTAAALWRALVGGATRSELVEVLVAGAPVERQRAEADVDEFLAELERNGLLQRETGIGSTHSC